MDKVQKLDPALTRYLVIGNNHGWASGETEIGTIKQMHWNGAGGASEFHVYRVTKDTKVDHNGDLTYPKGDAVPVLIRKVGGI
jgi:hypothetical protein